tara:strand:+ start:393664 stop:395226 length:1563 start_codon:yes stop_codon:yes gene_type:complete
MNQEWLMKNVLKHQSTVPVTPNDGRDYLSLEEAQAIVDETVDYLGEHGSSTEYTYVNGHRKRLAHSLSMIPMAEGENDSCLDIGCYGYMLLWAKKHLGYSRIVGIEWHPDKNEPILERTLKLNDYSLSIESHNFDISETDWSIDDQFDTILFFEVLEHINHDPMGVMERLHQRLKLNGTLVMSVPNAISYKTLNEFLVGMPPWTYWFYQPDLSHEPRHCFEYTPLVFKSLIQSSGLSENAFRTIYAYSDPAQQVGTIEIAQAIGYTEQELGETMIINATKSNKELSLRYPDVIYSPNGYYENIYPLLEPKLLAVQDQFRLKTKSTIVESLDTEPENLLTCELQLQRIEQLQRENSTLKQLNIDAKNEQDKSALELHNSERDNHTLRQQLSALNDDMNQMLFNYDCLLQNENQHKHTKQEADDALVASMIEAKNCRNWAESLVKENADLNGRVDELLFACDCYLQQVNDPSRCVQVVREQRFRNALQTTKSIARKTPILRTALRPVYRNTKKFIKRHVARP